MTYEEKYRELVELSHSENSEIKEKADAWLIGIGLQGAAELNVSAFLLDLAVRNVKGEITGASYEGTSAIRNVMPSGREER